MMIAQVGEQGQLTLPEEIRAAYHLDTRSRLLFVPLDGERFVVRVMPARRSIFELMDLYADDGPVPDIAAEREALGDALEETFRTGGPRP